MPPAFLGFLLGCFWFGAFMAAHIAILHFKKTASPSRCLIQCFAGAVTTAMACIALAQAAGWPGLLLAEIYGLMTMGCLFILYAPFFYTIYTSLSTQSLLAIQSTGGNLSVEALVQRFASRELFQGRLATMTASGYLAEERGQYRLTAKGALVARYFAAVKSFWRLGPGG